MTEDGKTISGTWAIHDAIGVISTIGSWTAYRLDEAELTGEKETVNRVKEQQLEEQLLGGYQLLLSSMS